MPPVPKKADWPNDSSPVKPNRMSKPRPNRPQIRMRLIVVGREAEMGQHERRDDQADRGQRFDERRDALEHRWRALIRGPAAPSSPCGRSTSTSVIATNSMT